MSSVDPDADTSPELLPDEESDDWEHHIALGPFELIECIGEGGMGEVWRGRHRTEDIPIAAKIITGSHRSEDKSLERFKREVRSIASLNHPGIITVLDYGTLPAEIDRQSSGRFWRGTPYYVMELADEGSLKKWVRHLSWSSVYHTLLSILEALGQAHARHIIHRDLKPSNVLLTQSPEGHVRAKLSDFGLAFLQNNRTSEELEKEKACGTPFYMAPEQLKTRWRDYGPWTDLYALGCLAWELTTGAPPYRGDTFMEVAEQHLQSPLPRYDPVAPVPDAFERWLRRLLQGHPSDRFQTTASASWSLLMIGEKSGVPEDIPSLAADGGTQHLELSPPSSPLHSLADETLRGEQASQTLDAMAPETDSRFDPSESDTPPPLKHERPPLPLSWETHDRFSTPDHLLGAGLELFDFREIPMIDREPERDLLWRTFVDSVNAQRTRVALLTGGSGRGKTRLAQWVRERGHRFGAAHTMEATHARSNSPSDELLTMLERFFRCVGLDREGVEKRIRRWMELRDIDTPDELDLGRLAALIRPEVDAEGRHHIPVANAAERREYVRRTLDCVARDRPLILQLDDLQWGRSTLEWLRHLLDAPRQPDAPIYCVGTVRPESLAGRTQTRQIIESLIDREAVVHQTLEPLDDIDHRKLIGELLQFDPTLSRRLLDRSEGNPLFAIQLIKDWVDRDLMEVGEYGFTLRNSADPHLPDDLFDLWRGRLERVLENYSDEAGVALELAAALGREVTDDECQPLSRIVDVSPPSGLLADLLRNRLIERTESGWQFAHDMLRETLERRARHGGRWHQHNLACAQMLEERSSGDEFDRTYRLGHHYLEAERYEEAIDPLIDALELCGRRSDFETASYLESRLDDAFEAAELPESDPRWGWYVVARVRLQYSRSRGEMSEQSIDQLESIRAMGEKYGHDFLVSQALHAIGQRFKQKETDYQRALNYYTRALDRIEPAEHPSEYGRVCRTIGEVHLRLGNLEAAADADARAIELLEESPGARAKATCELGRVELERGHPHRARSRFEEALSLFKEVESPQGISISLNALGDIALQNDNLERARQYYERAREYARITVGYNVIAIEFSLIHLHTEQDNYQRAFSILERVRREFNISSRGYFNLYESIFGFRCALHLEQNDLDQVCDSLLDELQSASSLPLEHLQILNETLREAREGGEREHLVEVAREVARHWQHLDEEEQARQICEMFDLDVSDVFAA